MPPSRLTIHTAALQANYKLLAGKVAPGCQVAAVVKANAYGVGIDVAVPALVSAGAKFFYVAQAAEAIELRKYTDAPIAVLADALVPHIDLYAQHQIIPVLNTADDVRACPADLPAIWHIDTGMNRLGLEARDVPDLAAQASARPRFIMTHFTSSDDAGSPHAAEQVKKFDACIAALPASFQEVPHSICNSSGIFRGRDWHRGQVRPGLALYGANPTPETANPMARVITLETQILQIRQGKAGETVGYNQTETLVNDTLLATVAFGYADGLLRAGSSRAKLYWQGHPCKIMGRVSMDLIVVALPNLPSNVLPKQGDVMEVIGPHQSVDDLARDLGTISYEVLTSLSRRAERIVL